MPELAYSPSSHYTAAPEWRVDLEQLQGLLDVFEKGLDLPTAPIEVCHATRTPRQIIWSGTPSPDPPRPPPPAPIL